MGKTIRRLALWAMVLAAIAEARRRVDGVVAVIGDSVILESELQSYAYLKASQLGQNLDSATYARDAQALLGELIDGKVLLVRAEKDTNVVVGDDDVERAVETRLLLILREYRLTQEQFEEQLKAEQDMTLTKFRAQLRKQIRQELIKQKVQQRYTSDSKVGKNEVEAFYLEYRDSLPEIGESVLLSMLRIHTKPSTAVRQAAYDKILSLKQRLDNGEDFSELAKKFSDGPNAPYGGDIGLIAKGSLGELAFEEKAFSLSPGEISEPFETRLGFHIVTVLARKEHKIHVKQIFIRVAPPDEEVQKAIHVLDSVRANATTADWFAAAVRAYSTDNLSRSRDGLLKWRTIDALTTGVRGAIDSLQVGEISEPVKDDDAVSVYRVQQRVPSRKLTIADDWNDIETIARRIYQQKQLIELVKRWREETFVDVRL